MKQVINLSFCILLIIGCGTPPPEVDVVEIRPDEQRVSSAKPINVSETDWNLWRGRNQDGIVKNADLPIHWSETQNVLWKSAISGVGHSSPIIIGDKVFLTTADEQSEQQMVLCLNRQSGDQEWSTVVNKGEFLQKHPKNSFASATPASDGNHLFVAFINHDRLQLAAINFDGDIVWDKEVGQFVSDHGYGPSPTLYDNLVIVSGDWRAGGFLAAVDRASGEIVWRVRRETTAKNGNYSSPIVAELAGRPQLIQIGYRKTISYDPATGEEIWRVAGPSMVTANTPVVSDPYIIVTGGFPQKSTMCIRADGTGDVTESHILWDSQKNSAYVPSPIIDWENVIVINGDGIGTSYKIKTGKRNWQERIGGNFSASPILANGHFYITNETGDMTVFKGGDQFEKIAVNKLSSSGGMATPAVSGNQIFVRTRDYLYCIGNESTVEK